MSSAQRRRERRAEREAEYEAELQRRQDNPTIEEQVEDRLDALIYKDGVSPDVEELARIFKLHVTGSEH